MSRAQEPHETASEMRAAGSGPAAGGRDAPRVATGSALGGASGGVSDERADPPDAAATEPEARPALPLSLAAILALAAALRLAFALRKGLVLDEFHTHYHASAAHLGELFERLRLDNHPPLSFLVVRALSSLFGDDELVLRAPALAFGLVEIALVWRLARRLPAATYRAAPPVAAALLALSSLHLDFSTQARMYALHALAVTALTCALLALLEAEERAAVRRRALAVGACLVVGAHAHYFFLHYAFALVLAVCATAYVSPAWRPRLLRLAAPIAGAALLCAPWYLWGFRAQLAHGLPPGGKAVGLDGLAESLVHLFFLNVRFGGEWLRPVFIACGVLAALLAALGAFHLVRSARTPPRRGLAFLLCATSFGTPVLATAVAAVYPRSGFTWHYVLPSAAACAVLAGAAACVPGWRRFTRPAVALVLAAALALSLLHVASRGTEDYPGAVRSILDAHRPGDAVISVEWQPDLFSQGRPWDYYAPRLVPPGGEPPPRLEMNEGFGLARPAELERYERVFVLRTSLPEHVRLMRILRQRFEERSEEHFGFGVSVLSFEARR